MFTTKAPDSDELREAYFHFRWLHLREPWNFPPGSERDEYEQISEHRIIVNDDGHIVACGRVHLNTAEEAQIRHIAVSPQYRHKRLGQLIMSELEQVAMELGATRAITNSRETSVAFFSACGFCSEGEAANELGMLKRLQMVKRFDDKNSPLRHPDWCAELQKTWEETIPISHHMGIKLHRYTGYQLEVVSSLNKNINIHGTMFAGSIFSLSTLTGWGLIYLQLKKRGLQGEIVLGDGDIHYHKPVTSNPKAICDITDMSGTFDKLERGKKCPFDIKVNVFDGDNPVAEFEGKYWVLPQKKQ